MFDVFYIGNSTGIFPHEKQADSVDHACKLSRTRYLWIVDGNNDYSQFDWLWEPVPWESDQAHVWPSQHQDNGNTWLVPKTGYQNINRNHSVITRNQSAPRLHIKHIPDSKPEGTTTARYISDYLGTMRRALSKTNWEHCWVTADVCDYTNFDFTWHPSEWQQDMLHVFPSNEQKFGDTFYVHVPSFLAKSEKLKILEWFDTLHFVEDISVPRFPVPTVQYVSDSVVDAIWQHEFTTPLVEFYTSVPMENHAPTVSLWQESTKTVVPLSHGNGTVVVPRECKNYIKTQVYDYPYIDKTKIYLDETPLDIVFISNGEPYAEFNYEHLKWAVQQKGLDCNQIHHSAGVNGRVAAYQAAAKLSTTPWFFAVFAKLEVSEKFNWNWQPDRMQQPKHYIFHAGNPVNGLVYGHQAMIAYNKKLVLENNGDGLDFTMDQPHEVVPIISGTANYAESPWMAWRTAFREVLKLRHSLPDVENEYRLKVWLKEDSGTIANGHWSHKGAQDAIEYYEAVNGDPTELKKSYEWTWLASYAFMRRNLKPDQ
jgi:hypothetical protein